MATADEYQGYANECLAWARKAKTDAERKAFLDMAHAWTQAAAMTANRVAIPPSMAEPSGEADPKV